MDIERSIDAHSHIWTPDVAHYPLAPGYTVGDMRPSSFTAEELLATCRPSGVGRVNLIQMIYYQFDNSDVFDPQRHNQGLSPVDPKVPYFLNSLDDPVDVDARNYHFHSGQFGNDRLSVARRVLDCNEAIRSALPIRHADLLLGVDPPDTPIIKIAYLTHRDRRKCL